MPGSPPCAPPLSKCAHARHGLTLRDRTGTPRAALSTNAGCDPALSPLPIEAVPLCPDPSAARRCLAAVGFLVCLLAVPSGEPTSAVLGAERALAVGNRALHFLVEVVAPVLVWKRRLRHRQAEARADGLPPVTRLPLD